MYSMKPNVVAKKGKETKDGLHIVFGLSMHHSIQLIIRDVVMNLEETERQIFFIFRIRVKSVK